FPTTQLAFSDGLGDGYAIQPQSTALDLSRWMPAAGTALVFQPGLHLAGNVPLSGLPAPLKAASGLTDDGASIAFAGSIDATLGALSGKSAVKGIELRALLPAADRSAALPAFLT